MIPRRQEVVEADDHCLLLGALRSMRLRGRATRPPCSVVAVLCSEIVHGEELVGEKGLQLEVWVVDEAAVARRLRHGHERLQRCLEVLLAVVAEAALDELRDDQPYPWILVL